MYLENGDDEIAELFANKYGIRKNGTNAGSAQSLISKYAYFITNYKFPIYDNLVQIAFPLIANKFPSLKLSNLPKKFEYSYFQQISELNIVSNINNFDTLDNLLWLFGKLKEGSFSLILNKDKYKKLVEQINITDKMNSKETDEIIRKYIIDNINSKFIENLFSKNSLEFIKSFLL